MRLRLIAPMLVVIAVIAGAFAVTRIESLRDGVLVLAGGLALAAVTGALAATTERRSRALREVERYFTLSPEMVIFAGFDGYWKRVNPAVEAVLGYTEREALARPFMEFVHPDDRERSEEEARRVLGGATALAFENRIVCKDGSYKLIEWTVTPVPEERVMYGVGRDITERRRSESEQAALRRVATLVARDAPSTEVFEAVATEVAKLLDTDITVLGRYDDDGAATAIGSWSASPVGVPVGTRSVLGGHNVLTLVAETGKPARVDGYDDASGEAAEIARRFGWSSSIAAPVIVEGRLWGVMLVATQGAEPFPPGAEERLAAFTDLVATAVANTQARQEVTALADEQAALRHVATLVAQQPSPGEVFAAVTQAVRRLLDADLAVLHVLPGDGTTMIASWSGDGPTLPIGTRFPLDGDSLAARIFETAAPARIDNYAEAEGEIADRAQSLGVRSTVGAPILVEGKLWGALMAATRRVEPWGENAETRIAAFTELIATAIANAESREALADLAEEQAALRRVATLVAQGAAPQDLFDAVAEEVGRLLLAANVSMGRYEADGSLITSMASWSSAGPVFPPGGRWPTKGTSVAWMVLQTGRSARIDDFSAATDPIGVAVREAGYKSAIGSPIVVEGRLWGVISAASTEGPMPRGSEARLASFTELVATAIANTQARQQVTVLADEQAALRRVATLVAREASHPQVFSTIAREIGELLGLEVLRMVRYEDDGAAVVVAGSGLAEDLLPVGLRIGPAVDSAASRVFRTGEAVRIDDYETASDAMTQTVRAAGIRGVVATPIWVEGRLWGAMNAGTTQDEPLPPGTEARLGQFSELMATAIANAESKSELAASRRRIVAASDETRRRIERDLHDGTQQRLVSLGLALRAAEANLPPERDDLRAQLSGVATGLVAAVEDLQEISRGIHPAILSKGGLGPALQALAHRSAIPVDLEIATDMRLEEPIEVAAYFVASEALANAAKHSDASRIDVSLDQRDGRLLLSVRDDGVGGADAARGSGLVGLTDRVEALSGSIRIDSRPGEGTQIAVELPVEIELPQPAG